MEPSKGMEGIKTPLSTSPITAKPKSEEIPKKKIDNTQNKVMSSRPAIKSNSPPINFNDPHEEAFFAPSKKSEKSKVPIDHEAIFFGDMQTKTSAKKNKGLIDHEAIFFGTQASSKTIKRAQGKQISNSIKNAKFNENIQGQPKNKETVSNGKIKNNEAVTKPASYLEIWGSEEEIILKPGTEKTENVSTSLSNDGIEPGIMDAKPNKINPNVEHGITLLKNMTEPGEFVKKRQFENIDGHTKEVITGYKKMSLDELHDQNYNTTNEIIAGYKSVMTNDDLFTSLTKMYTVGSETDKGKCNDFAILWVKSGLHKNNYTDPKVQQFFKNCGSTEAQSLYEKAIVEAQQPQGRNPREEVSSWSDFMKGSPKEIANEFRSLFAEGQVNMTIDEIVNYEKDGAARKKYQENPEMKLQGNERFLSSNALKLTDTQNVLTDIILMDLLSFKDKKEAIGTYKKYLEVAEEAMNSGDSATTMFFVMTLGRMEKLIPMKELLPPSSLFSKPSTKEQTHFRIEGDLRGIGQMNGNAAALRNMAKQHPNEPTPSMLDFKDYIIADTGNEKTIDLDIEKTEASDTETSEDLNSETTEFNAERIKQIGNQFQTLHDRQENIKSNITGKYNLGEFLQKSVNNSIELEIEERKLEIQEGPGWGGERKNYDKNKYAEKLEMTRREFQPIMSWENLKDIQTDLPLKENQDSYIKLQMREDNRILNQRQQDGEEI